MSEAVQRADARAPAPTPQETLSQLLARIFDQLSISAWLPAAALVLICLLVGSLRHNEGDLAAAITTIGSLDLEDLLLLTGAVIVTTMLTQAFQFEAIRLLEGYWGTRWIPARLSDLLCRRQLRRRTRLLERASRAETRAVLVAQERMIRDRKPPTVVGNWVAIKLGGDLSEMSKADQDAATRLKWKHLAPVELRRMDALIAAADEFPKSDRLVLPTRFGNVLRAREEPLHAESDGSLRGFVHRRFHTLPPALQVEHDQFRARLDLYCSLVLVFAVSGCAATALLAGYGAAPVVSTGLTVLFTLLSYRAAIASARAYGDLLLTMARMKGPVTAPTPPAPS